MQGLTAISSRREVSVHNLAAGEISAVTGASSRCVLCLQCTWMMVKYIEQYKCCLTSCSTYYVCPWWHTHCSCDSWQVEESHCLCKDGTECDSQVPTCVGCCGNRLTITCSNI